MGYQDEDEPPCMHHRSQFDTLPAPAMTSSSREAANTGRLASDGFANVPLRFPGGDAEIRKPTREALVLSARQWVTRAREEMQEFDSTQESGCGQVPEAAYRALNHVCAVLAELAAL